MARTLLRGIDVGGLRIAIEAPPALPWSWPDGPLRRFAAPAEGADLVVGVRVAVPDPPASDCVRYDSGGGIFDVAREGRDWVIALRICGALQRVARFDAEFRMGEVLVHPDSFYAREAHYPLAYPLDEVLFLHRLARAGGLLVHACGIATRAPDRGDPGALLFSGPSGAGKTTVSRFALAGGDHRVLSDDRIVLRPDGDGFRVWGTPWHGDAPLSRQASAALRGIHLIRHSVRFDVEPLAGAPAAAGLLSNAFLPVHDPEAVAAALALAERVAARVPVHGLGFPRDPAVVPRAWSASRATDLPACRAA